MLSFFRLKLPVILLILSLLISWVASARPFDQTDYMAALETINNNPEFRDQLYIPQLSKYHVVFVGGFGNFIAGDRYFQDNSIAAMMFGAGHETRLMPSSRMSAEQNIPLLLERIYEAYEEGGRRPIILVGHSKGGLESVATILHHPELIRKRIVHSVVAIQAPLSVCELGSCSSRLLDKTRAIGVFNGMHSLDSRDIYDLIDSPLRSMHASTRKMLSEKVFYITSAQTTAKTARIIKAGSFIINQGFNMQGDGLVSLPGMVIPGFGNVLGHLEGDHLEFTVSPSLIGRIAGLTTSKTKNIWAFTYLLGKSVTDYVSSKKTKNTCSAFYGGS